MVIPMTDSKTEGSIFSEMAERRSRSDELQARAIERGLEVEQEPVASVENESVESEVDMKPAFDMESFESDLVSKNEVQKIDSVDAVEEAETFESDLTLPVEPEPILEIPADPVVAEVEPEDADFEKAEIVDEEEGSESLDAVEETVTGAPSGEALESQLSDVGNQVESDLPLESENGNQSEGGDEAIEESASPEDLIVESGDLLGEAPEPIEDAEVLMAAEDLVDQIGSVVDIQSLPKTQPSRVLSKVSKSETKASEKPKHEVAVSEPTAETVRSESKAVKPDPTAAKPKKKKKKVSLLDSYFKGL